MFPRQKKVPACLPASLSHNVMLSHLAGARVGEVAAPTPLHPLLPSVCPAGARAPSGLSQSPSLALAETMNESSESAAAEGSAGMTAFSLLAHRYETDLRNVDL